MTILMIKSQKKVVEVEHVEALLNLFHTLPYEDQTTCYAFGISKYPLNALGIQLFEEEYLCGIMEC